MTAIADIVAREILDSRGNPTVEVDVVLEDGSMGRAAVPSGASTGAHEAVELRDGDKSRYLGKGVLKAVEAVNGEILEAHRRHGRRGSDRRRRGDDRARRHAQQGPPRRQRDPRRLARRRQGARPRRRACRSTATSAARRRGVLPVPMMNIINGGAHADNPIDFQEFMIMPVGAPSLAEAVRMGAEVFHTLKKALKRGRPQHQRRRRGRLRAEPALGRGGARFHHEGDRGGRLQARRGHRCWRSIAPRPSSSRTAAYHYEGEGKLATVEKQVEYLAKLVPRLSDRLHRGRHGRGRLGRLEGSHRADRRRCQLVGDDLFVTNVARLSEGIAKGVANSILVKVNQIGTLTETLAAVEMAQRAGYTAVMSHRSGETEDATIADLAVATNCGQIKTGSLARSDRTGEVQPAHPHRGGAGPQARYAGRAAIKALGAAAP